MDDRAGVIVDVQVTTGAESESRKLLAQVQQVQAQLGVTPQVVTADRGYASSANYAALEQAGIQGVIPPQPEATSRRGVPLRRFAYDAKHDCARCPAGKRLTRRNRSAHGWFYRGGPGTPGLSAAGAVRAHHGSGAKPAHSRRIPGPLAGATALPRGWPAEFVSWYRRHRGLVEGVHGEAKTQHGLRRAVRRGLANMRIQAYLTAAVINLKRLALHAASFFAPTAGRRPRLWLARFCPRRWYRPALQILAPAFAR